jgi:hypothetical protein
LYSAKEKWNLDFRKFPLVHAGSFLALAPLPNQEGLGSETKSFWLGMTLIEGVMLAQVVDVVENALRFWARTPVKKREELKSRRECIDLQERMLFECCNEPSR